MPSHEVIEHGCSGQAPSRSGDDKGIHAMHGIDRRSGGEVAHGTEVLLQSEVDEPVQMVPLDEGGEEPWQVECIEIG